VAALDPYDEQMGTVYTYTAQGAAGNQPPAAQGGGTAYDAPIPGGPLFAQAALAAKTAYQNTVARLNQQRSGLLRQKGYLGDVTAEGTVSNVRVDPNSMYGEFQLANRDQAFRDESAVQAGLQRGLGMGGGLAAQQRNRTRFAFGAEDANLGTSLVEGLAGFQDAQTGAAQERDRALWMAELEGARSAIQEEDFNPANLEGLDIPEYGNVPAGGVTPTNPFTKAKTSSAKKAAAKLPKGYYAPMSGTVAATKKVSAAAQKKAKMAAKKK
jgi:hypothetical protein